MIWALIPASDKKAWKTCEAWEMYWPSTHFRMTWQVAEQTGQTPLIISAKYGVLQPHQIIEPYNLPLWEQTTADRKRLAGRMVKVLGRILTRGDQVVSYLGDKYARHLVPELRSRCGVAVEEPLKGMKLGFRSQWLSETLAGQSKAKVGP